MTQRVLLWGPVIGYMVLIFVESSMSNAPLPSNEALVTYADVGKARELLGYDPRVSIEDGLGRFWAWYQTEVLGT